MVDEKDPKEITYEFVVKSLLDDLDVEVWDENLFDSLKYNYLQGKCSLEMFNRYIKENNKPTSKVLKPLKEKLSNMMDKRNLAEKLVQESPMYYDNARNWWIWSFADCKWIRTDETDILNAVESIAQVNTINAKEKNETLEAIKQVSRINRPLDLKPTWVQFKDMIVDILTGEQIPATPKYFATNPIPYEFHEDKFYLTPTIDKIFEEWVGKEYVQQLYEIMAYCLIPDYPLHRIFCFIGAGSNGKSKYLELLRKFVGPDNVCSTELDSLINNRFEISRLHKKLVCQMGETNFNELSKTSILKKLSGGDLIGFEHKGKDLFEEKNYAKLIIATNNLPTTTDKTIGFYRRWMIIDFPNQFSEGQDVLSLIPEEEYRSLSIRLSLTLKDLLTNRKFTNEGSVEERMEKYESKSNFLEQFCKLALDKEVDGYITCSEFYKRFTQWSKENRHRDMSETSVGIGMKKMGFEQSRKNLQWLNDGKGGQARVWMGIKWK